MKLTFDFETRSDINIKTAGAWTYISLSLIHI